MDLERLECKNCGAALDYDERKNGVITCRYCKMSFVLPKEKQISEVLTTLTLGDTELANGSFERAYTAFSRAAELDGTEPEAYFGMALAEYKVQYLKDAVNDKLQPICHEISDKKFTDNANYKKAVSLATAAQKEVYQKRAAEIDDIKEKFRVLEKSGFNYDAFICVKVSKDDGKGHTEDRFAADKIYHTLKEEGFKPFFSEEEIGKRTGTDYEAMILYALHKAKCMIIVCFDESYLKTKWVKNEYTRYISMQNLGQKNKDSVAIVFNGAPIEKLPGIRGKLQGVNYKDAFASKTLTDFVSRHVYGEKKSQSKKKTPVFIAAALAGVMAIGAGAFFLVPKDTPNNPDSGYSDPSGPSGPQTSTEVQFGYELSGDGYKLTEVVPNGNTSITVPAAYEGVAVTSIGADAFKDCSSVLTITLPESVTTIENKAFANCSGLKTLKLPSGVTGYSSATLYGLGSLEKLTFAFTPSSVVFGELFGAEPYAGAEPVHQVNGNYYVPTSLKEVVVEGSALPQSAFVECTAIEEITLSDSIAAVPEECFKGCTSLMKVELPSGAVSIGNSAFSSCSKLLEVVASESTVSIGDKAFEGCAMLKKAIFPTALTTVGETPFKGCAKLQEVSLTFKTKTLAEYFDQISQELTTVTATGDGLKTGAFENCAMIENITLSQAITEIPDNAFLGCRMLTGVILPQNLTTIGDRAFEECLTIAKMDIPESVTSIGADVLKGCENLESLKFPFASEVVSLGYLFGETTAPDAATPALLSETGDGGEGGAESGEGETKPTFTVVLQGGKYYSVPDCLKSVEIYGESLPSQAFRNCAYIKNVVLSEDIPEIGQYTFENCYALEEIDFGAPDYIRDYAFQGCTSLKNILLPESVTGVGFAAFQSCSAATEISVPDSVTEVGDYAFYGLMGAQKLFWNVKSINFAYADDVFNLLGYSGEGVDVEFGNSVEKVPSYFINSNQKLKTITFEENSVCTEIGTYAFYSVGGLVSVQIPESVTAIKNNAFALCHEEAKVEITSLKAWLSIDFETTSASPLCNGADLYLSGSKIENLVVPTTVTEIKKNALYGSGALKSVTLHDGVTKVGLNAFTSCKSLTNIYAPSLEFWFGLTLEENSNTTENPIFSPFNLYIDGELLTDLTLPAIVTELDGARLQDCLSLQKLTVPETLIRIENRALSGCKNVTAVNWNTDSVLFPGYNRAAFSGLGADGGGIALTFGDNVTEIPANFKMTNATSATLGENVTKIGASAFADCTLLKTVNIPEKLQTVGNYAFQNCNIENLQWNAKSCADFTYSAKVFENVNGTAEMTVTFGENVESIPYYALESSRLSKILFEGNKCTSIGNYAFSKTLLTEVVLPDSLTSIGNYCFAGCAKLTKMTLPFVGTTSGATGRAGLFTALFDSNSYSGATSTQQYYTTGTYTNTSYIPNSLKEVVVNGGSVGYGAFMNCKYIEKITVKSLDNGVIGDNAFSYCSVLKEISLPDNVTEFGIGAFGSCTALTEISMPETVTKIGADAFFACSALTKVTTPSVAAWCNITFGSRWSNPTEYTKALTVDGKILTELTLPDSLEKVNAYAFVGLKDLTSVKFGSGLMEIGADAFMSCENITSVEIKDLDGWCEVEFGNVNSNPTQFAKGLILNGKALTEVSPSSSVARVGAYAFYNCINIEKITLPSGITQIGKGAFYNAKGLKELVYNAANVSDFEKENNVFTYAGQTSGFSLLIGADVKSVPANLFAPCGTVNDGNSHETCKKYAPKLTEVTFANGYGVERIGENAFYYCLDIEKAVIPELSTWFTIDFENSTSNPVCYSYCLFVGDTELAEINETNIPSGITEIKPYTFYRVQSLTKAVLPEGIKKIGSSAFYSCSINELSLPNGLTEIGESAFYYLDATSVDIPDSVEIIDGYAFAFSELTSFIFPENLRELGANVLYYTDVEEITWNVRNAPDYETEKSPLYTYGFNKVTFGKNVERIPAYFLEDGSALEIIFEEGSVCKEIADYAFYCANVKTITLPEGITRIGRYAFAYGQGIQEITIPESVEYIGVSAFNVNYTLKTVNFNAIACQDSDYTGFTYYPFGTDYTEVNIGAKVTRIPALFFCYGKMTEIKFAEGNALEEIGDYAFYCCRYLATMNLPDTLIMLGQDVFYSDNYNGTGYMVPYYTNNVTAEEDGGVYMGNVLVSAPTGKSGTYTVKEGTIGIGGKAFYNTSYTSIVIPEGCTSIGAYAFGSSYSTTSISSITLPASIKKIGNYAFKGASSVYFKGTVRDWLTIEFGLGNANPFYENILYIGENKTPASSITSVSFPVGTTKIGRSALVNFIGLTSITVPDTVTEIADYAFYNCKNLTSITLPAGLRSIGSYAFSGCSNLTNITFKGTLNDWLTIDFAEAYANPAYTGSTTSSTTLTINGVNANTIESVTVPSSMKLGSYALSGLSNLKEVVFEEGTKEIPKGALYDCFALEKATLPNTVKTIGDYAFYRCVKLENIVFPTSLETIGNYAFYRCLGFTGELVLPDGVKTVLEYAFSTCENITSVTLSENLTEVDNYVFLDCISLTKVRMGNKADTIRSWAFKNCSALTTVYLSDNLQTIWAEAFVNCSSLTRVYYDGGYGWNISWTSNTSILLDKDKASSSLRFAEYLIEYAGRKWTRSNY